MTSSSTDTTDTTGFLDATSRLLAHSATSVRRGGCAGVHHTMGHDTGSNMVVRASMTR